jgi:hypothetical protein
MEGMEESWNVWFGKSIVISRQSSVEAWRRGGIAEVALSEQSAAENFRERTWFLGRGCRAAEAGEFREKHLARETNTTPPGFFGSVHSTGF